MVGYETANRSTLASELEYRSSQLYDNSPNDMLLLANLHLENDFDMLTSKVLEAKLEEFPDGMNNVSLNIFTDDPASEPAKLLELKQNPHQAKMDLGNVQVVETFMDAYRQFITLESAGTALKKMYLSFGEKNELSSLFHSTIGKDRTEWAATALVTNIDLPEKAVIDEYLHSNEYHLPIYEDLFQQFVDSGGYSFIPEAIFGVKAEYLDAAFDGMQTKNSSIEYHSSECPDITIEQQSAMRSLYLLYHLI